MNKKPKTASKVKQIKLNNIIIAEAVIIVILGITVGALAGRQPKIVANFDQCISAGGSELIPEDAGRNASPTCVIDGVSFNQKGSRNQMNNKPQRPNRPSSDVRSKQKMFMGLTEVEAMEKAQDEDITVRVLERDGQPLPMTMDLIQGRVNLSIKDGVVYKVDVEQVDSIDE